MYVLRGEEERKGAVMDSTGEGHSPPEKEGNVKKRIYVGYFPAPISSGHISLVEFSYFLE